MTDRFLMYRTPEPVEDPTPFGLLLLLQDIQRGNDNFFVLEDQEVPDRFAQVIRADAANGDARACYGTRADKGYVVEYRDGDPGRHFQADCPTLEVAHELLTGWMTGGDGWRDLVIWRRLDFEGDATDGDPSESGESFDGEPDEDQVTYVRGEVRAMVLAGFSAWPEVARAAEEMLNADVSSATRTAAVRAAQEEWDQRVAEQAGWEDQGDYDKLAAAFADLESGGLVARMSFACCSSCGNAEIGGEVDPVGPVPPGFVYFHSQDAARLAVAPSTLYLAYGAFHEALGIETGPDGLTAEQQDSLAAATREVGRLVADAMAEHGLGVVWTDDPNDAVKVTVTDWRKRLPA
ncbi:DUF6891 domain-containing protein [Antribacter gilvus]|uniref:DUF6891 domain-containing protein n=1 Tax=Antribacter gilvus TaxID=2304675 RepID=UPI000F78B57C|nr:hypothetical protein [Antribacter gilvus]